MRELWVRGDLYRRRADIIGFINGLPLLFMELKNVSKDIRAAYEQNFLDYKESVPHLFHHNAFVVLANGVDAKLGSVNSRFEHFHEWKRLAENQPGVVAMETLLKGVCAKANLLDLAENFIVFDDSAGDLRKILARNHQLLGVNRAIEAVRDRKLRDGKLGCSGIPGGRVRAIRWCSSLARSIVNWAATSPFCQQYAHDLGIRGPLGKQTDNDLLPPALRKWYKKGRPLIMAERKDHQRAEE